MPFKPEDWEIQEQGKFFEYNNEAAPTCSVCGLQMTKFSGLLPLPLIGEDAGETRPPHTVECYATSYCTCPTPHRYRVILTTEGPAFEEVDNEMRDARDRRRF